MRNKKNNLWTLDRQGGLAFTLRSELAERENKADSLWEYPAVAVVVMLLCGTLDCVLFLQLFSSFLYDHVLIQFFSVIGCLVGFDLAPIYLGILMRKKNQSFRIPKFMPALLIFAFTMVIIGNVWLRIELRDLVLPASSSTGTSLFGTATQEAAVNPGALPYAIFAALLPIVASVVSFAISYKAP